MKFNKWLYKEQFNPSHIGIFINPFYHGRRAIYLNIRKRAVNIRGRILDVGCGSKPYKELFQADEYFGIDVNTSGHSHKYSEVDLFYDGINIPISDCSFDSIVCFEVLEVISEPDHFLNEINRVLKPGGKALFTVPFVWDEHEQPYDYSRYSSFGLKYLFEKHGFSVRESEKYLADLRLFCLLSNAYLYKVVRRILPSRIAFIILLPFTSLINLLGSLLYFSPGNPDLYFGNVVLIEKADNKLK